MTCQYSINKFAYDGGDKPGQGGTVTLYVDGKSVGSGYTFLRIRPLLYC